MNVPVKFPSETIPSDASHAKLLGIYAQRQEGLYLQRVRISCGLPAADQWRAMAAVARRLTPATPLHLTTRQDVEIHDLTAATLPQAQAALAAAGLTGFASAGDTARNVAICPCMGLRGGRADVQPLAKAIERELAAIEGIYALPRKFKVSISGCPNACAKPYINDIGLVAKPDGRFVAVVAGSLGAKPGTGIVLNEDMPIEGILPLVRASVKFFAAHGDRQNRRAARLRHVRERMGDEAFLSSLRGEIEREQTQEATAKTCFRNDNSAEAHTGLRSASTWHPSLPPLEGNRPASSILTFPNGDLAPEAADALAALAEGPEMIVHIALHHQVVVIGPTAETIQSRIAALPRLHQAAAPQPTVVACPGARWCSRGLADTNALADSVRAALGRQLAPKQTVCISGCPNGCATAR